MKIFEQKLTHSCLKAMTLLPVVSLSSCIIWPAIQSTRNCVGRRLCKCWMARTQWIGQLLLRKYNKLTLSQFSKSIILTKPCFGLILREDLNKIPYTTMCIKESLRMHPPVPGISRKTTKPITFFDGRTLPAGLLHFYVFFIFTNVCSVDSSLL